MSSQESTNQLPKKECNKCFLPKDLDEFGTLTQARDGKNPTCMECTRQYRHKIYHADLDKARAKGRKDAQVRRTNHPERERKKGRESSRKYRAKNPKQALQNSRKSKAKHRDKESTKRKKRRAANPEHFREIGRASKARRKARNPELYRAQNATEYNKRRAAKLNAERNDLTKDQWLEIQAAQDHRCYYCGKRRKGKLTQDHLTPLSKGGSHTVHNVIAACQSCNSKKWANAPTVPVQPFLLTIASAKKKIA